MFSSKGLFKHIACPAGTSCKLPNCIFGHSSPSNEPPESSKISLATELPAEPKSTDHDDDLGSDRKRRKLDGGGKAFVGTLVEAKNPASHIANDAANGLKALPSLSRDITPPKSTRTDIVARGLSSSNDGSGTTRVTASSSESPQASIKAPQPAEPSPARNPRQTKTRIEDLNPRLVSTNPAPHTTRLKLLQMMHEQMTRLNLEADQHKKLSTGKLVKLALDEEERLARSQASVYRTVMSHAVMRYKKMQLPEWLVILDSKQSGQPLERKLPLEAIFSTELSPELERRMLSRYHIKLEGLDKYGYVLEPPTEAEIASTQRAIEMSDHWEFCDRCATRFQVFPHRREDGALTNSGTCQYHWARPFREKKTKEVIFQCCNGPHGTPGCTTHATHVFKTTDRTRMAQSLQFEHTPPNPTTDPSLAVAFDCEMGYTTIGMEMIRISATTWPEAKRLFDILVRPIGHVLDLNTRFSGVTPSQFLNAQDYNGNAIPGPEDTSLYILSSPQHARNLFFSLISPNTPLIGHSIDNDLNVLRMIHPTIIDTVVLYPHPSGLPMRYGLKRLTKEYLRRDIQNAGAEGHDSLEDATATGDLVRAKLTKEWKVLKSEGWKVENGAFVVPEGWKEKGAGAKFMTPQAEWWK